VEILATKTSTPLDNKQRFDVAHRPGIRLFNFGIALHMFLSNGVRFGNEKFCAFGLNFSTKPLPTCFLYAGDFAPTRQFSETNPAKIKIPNIAALPTAAKTTPHNPRRILWLLSRSGDDRIFSHVFSMVPQLTCKNQSLFRDSFSPAPKLLEDRN